MTCLRFVLHVVIKCTRGKAIASTVNSSCITAAWFVMTSNLHLLSTYILPCMPFKVSLGFYIYVCLPKCIDMRQLCYIAIIWYTVCIN